MTNGLDRRGIGSSRVSPCNPRCSTSAMARWSYRRGGSRAAGRGRVRGRRSQAHRATGGDRSGTVAGTGDGSGHRRDRVGVAAERHRETKGRLEGGVGEGMSRGRRRPTRRRRRSSRSARAPLRLTPRRQQPGDLRQSGTQVLGLGRRASGREHVLIPQCGSDRDRLHHRAVDPDRVRMRRPARCEQPLRKDDRDRRESKRPLARSASPRHSAGSPDHRTAGPRPRPPECRPPTNRTPAASRHRSRAQDHTPRGTPEPDAAPRPGPRSISDSGHRE